MYIKYEYIGDRTLLSIPAGKLWSLRFLTFDKDGNEDYSVYLTVEGNEPICVLDVDLFCQGSPNLPYYAVGHLYEDLIDVAAEHLMDNPDPPLLDIPALAHRLVDTKYRDLWHKKGYIPADWLKYD